MKKGFLFRLSIVAALLPASVAAQDVREANFQFKQENYQYALKLYLGAYKKDTSNVDYAYSIGICKTKTYSKPDEALDYLLKAEKKYGQDGDFLVAMVYAYFYRGEFAKAREALKKAEAKLKNDKELKLLSAYIGNAEKMVQKPADVTFVNLGKDINSALDETTPMITSANDNLYYTSNQKFDTQLKLYTTDIFSSYSEEGDFKKGRVLSPICTLDDEFAGGLSDDGSTLYFRLDGLDAFQDLMWTEIQKNTVKGKTKLSEKINTKKEEQAAWRVGDTLFFSSSREGGLGGLDLYFAVQLPTGEWSDAESLGNKINTEYDESYPMVSSDGRKLYFCSNGTKSMGGYDIFVCNIDPKTRALSEPRNIGYPLNDVYDNKTIAYTADGNYAYVSAIKSESFGGADIYRVIFNDRDPLVKLYQVKLVTQEGEQKVPLGSAGQDLKITVQTKGSTVYGTYVYNPTTSIVNVALLPGNYVLQIEGASIEPYSTKLNVPNAPGKKIENINAVVKPKK